MGLAAHPVTVTRGGEALGWLFSADLPENVGQTQESVETTPGWTGDLATRFV